MDNNKHVMIEDSYMIEQTQRGPYGTPGLKIKKEKRREKKSKLYLILVDFIYFVFLFFCFVCEKRV